VLDLGVLLARVLSVLCELDVAGSAPTIEPADRIEAELDEGGCRGAAVSDNAGSTEVAELAAAGGRGATKLATPADDTVGLDSAISIGARPLTALDEAGCTEVAELAAAGGRGATELVTPADGTVVLDSAISIGARPLTALDEAGCTEVAELATPVDGLLVVAAVSSTVALASSEIVS